MSSSDSEWNARAGWFKSTASGGDANCVEVNLTTRDVVGIRDSKAGGTGHVLVIPTATYRAFIGAVRAGEIA